MGASALLRTPGRPPRAWRLAGWAAFIPLKLAHTKLCSSRAFWLVAYPGQGHELLFDAHARAFAAFGGVPQRGFCDNMKTAVDKVLSGW
jgi:transposase